MDGGREERPRPATPHECATLRDSIYNVHWKLCTLLDLEALGSSHYSSFAFHIFNDIEE